MGSDPVEVIRQQARRLEIRYGHTRSLQSLCDVACQAISDGVRELVAAAYAEGYTEGRMEQPLGRFSGLADALAHDWPESEAHRATADKRPEPADVAAGVEVPP